jgi:hypothetical protein
MFTSLFSHVTVHIIPSRIIKVKFIEMFCSAKPLYLTTVAALVQSQVRLCGICGGQHGTEAGCFLVLWFPLPVLIPPAASYPLILTSTLYSLDSNSVVT